MRPQTEGLALFGIVGLLCGLVIGATALPRHVTHTVVEIRTTTPTCDPRLVAADLQVMRFGFDQLLKGHRKQAIAEVGANYAAISPQECQ